MAKVLCGCGRPAAEAACGACLGALRAAAGAKNDAARETLRLAAEVARLQGIVRSLAERVFVQSEVLTRLAERK